MKFYLLLVILLFSCKTTDNKVEEPEILFPYLLLTNPVEGSEIMTPVTGELTYIEQGNDGLFRAIIKVKYNYYYGNQIIETEYEAVLGGLLSVTAIPGNVKAGDIIGTMSIKPYLSSRVKKIDPFVVRSSIGKGRKYEGYWWFTPDWLLPHVTQSMTFRPVESLEDAIDDFYFRWAEEGISPEGTTIHYYPEFDRIRVPYVLNTYPKEIPNRTQALAYTEMRFYRNPGLFTLEYLIPREDKYNATLYWQRNFDEYLRSEYKLGDVLWLYCSIYTLDHYEQNIIICVRDFSLIPDEEIIKYRIDELKKDNPE